ncbi:hypothetical protein BSKO_03425 [Bryopsis sp. KO-2023]|nr:hypothetical protein BSKO_03425 [Bryopsis sp. KO-2023]
MPRDETLERLLDSARVTLGESLRKVDRLQEFSDSLRELLRDLAGKPQLRERDQLLEKLQNWIVDARKIGEGQPRPSPLQLVRNVTLQAFGSSVMGISGRGGDLDISLEGEVLDEALSPSSHLADASRLFKGDLLGEVHACLRHGNHFRSSKHTHLIRQAKVPVSKFVEMSTGIHCDLSIGNSSGVFKSQLLAEVLKMDSRVRELVVIVKKWARANNMNDPTCGSFNSYCLTLLVISFSQTRQPPLLPPFKDLFPGLRGILIDNGKPGSPSLCTLIEKYQKTVREWVEDHKNDEKNKETLCELLMGFLVSLSLYATHSQLMHYTAEGISKSTIRPTASPWEGGFISTGWEAKALKKYQLFVEDPFEAKDNCARTLATQDWWRICKTLQETVVAMEDFIHARSNLALYKWQDLWMVLFQRPSPGPFQMINSGGWREGSPEAESSSEERTAMIKLHRDALIEHLRRFKLSDKRFIAVSDSWWSREFKVYVMSAVDEMGLFRGDGPKKKLLISKDSDIKEALVEHAVNSTLRARKNQSTIIDPYDCVVKQRLREFLKCSLRYHVFHAAAFRKEIKDWVFKCVEEVGLGGEFMDSGDLRVERSADFRPPPSMTINGCHRIPYSAFVCSQDVFKVVEAPEIVCQNGVVGEAEKLVLVEQEEDDQGTGNGDSQQEDAPVTDPEELLSSDELEEVVRTEGGSSDVDEKSPSVNEASSSSEVTTIPSSSLDVIGASMDSDLPLRGVEFLENGVEDVETCGGSSESPRLPLDAPVVDSTELGTSTSNGVGGEDASNWEGVRVVIQCEGNRVAMSLTYSNGQRSEKTQIRRPDILGADYTNRVFQDVGLFPTASGQPEELLTPTIRKPPQEITIPAAGSPSKMNPEQHQRNAEILRHVFFDLFRRLEELKESECIMGEVQIDPTEFVVPVAWVRQQVRDIARNLFLEVVPMNGKKRRAMKIRVRKRRFDDSETDSEDFNRHMYRMSPQKRQARGMERVNLIRRGPDRLMGAFPLAPWPVPDDDQKDHVTHCLQWVKKQKRPFEFWTEIYPGDVQQGLRERAEELGLTVDINMDKMYLGVDHNPRRQNAPRFQTVCSHVLNDEVQLAIRRYLQQRMNQMLVEGKDSIQLPCKGFFMRPRWVTEEAMRIGGALGLEIVDMKDKVEVINSNKLAERQRLLHLLQQQQSNFVQKHQFSPPPMMPEGSGGSFGQHMGRQIRQPMLQRTLSGGHRYPNMESQNGHSSMLSAAQNILQMSQSSSFNSQPSPMISSNTPPPPSNGTILGSTDGKGEVVVTHHSDRPHSNGMRGSPAPESFMRQLRGEGAANSRNGNECNARHEGPGSGGGGNNGNGAGPWPQPRKGGRGHGRGNRRFDSKREGLPPRGGNETESQPPSRGRRGRGARRNRNG